MKKKSLIIGLLSLSLALSACQSTQKPLPDDQTINNQSGAAGTMLAGEAKFGSKNPIKLEDVQSINYIGEEGTTVKVEKKDYEAILNALNESFIMDTKHDKTLNKTALHIQLNDDTVITLQSYGDDTLYIASFSDDAILHLGSDYIATLLK